MRKLLLTLAVLCGTVSAWAQTVVGSNASVEKAYETSSWQQLENVPQEMVDANLVNGMTAADVMGIEEQVTVPQGYLWVQFAYVSGQNRLETIGIDVLDSEGNVLDSDYHFGYTGTYASNRDYNVFVNAAGTYTLRYWVTFKKEQNTSNGKITLKHVDGNIAHKKYYRIYTDAFAGNYVHINAYNATSGGAKGTVILKNEEENADQFFSFISTGEANKYYVKSLSGYYLKVNAWNYDANSSSKTAFVIEGTDAEGFTISQNEFTQDGTKTKAQTIDDVTYLFNNDATGNKWKLQEVDLNALTSVTVNYILKYNGEEKATQSVETKLAMPYPEVTAELPYGIVANRPEGNIKPSEVVDGVVTKEIDMTTNLPFVAASEPGSITKWYYVKMHSNNKKYIQNINDEYLEWQDATMDIASIDSYTWAFVGNPFDGFKMVNKASGLNKAVLSTGSGNPSMTAYADATAFVYSKTNENVSGGFCLKYPSSGQYLNAQSGKVAHWGAADAGSTFMIEGVLPVQLTTDDSNPYYYALKSGRGDAFWYTYDSSDGKISLGANTGADTQLWFFKGLYQDGKLCVQLYPKADPTKAMSYQNTNNDPAKIVAQVPETEGWKNTWKIVNTNGAARYVLSTPGGENYLSNNGGTSYKMGMWNDKPETDGGTAIYIYQTIDNIITDMAGNTYESKSFAQVGQLPEPAAFTGVAGYTLSNKCWIDNKFTADIDFGFPVSSLSQVNATMISSFGGSSFRWYADGTGVKAQKNVIPTPSNVVNYLWAIYPKLTEGKFTFTIKNIGADKYIYSTSSDNSHNAGVVTLEDEGSALTYESGSKFQLSTSKFLSLNSTKPDDPQIIGTWGSHPGTVNAFPSSSVSVQIGETGYSSIYLPFAVNLVGGVEAYAVKSVGGNYATLSEAKTAIPANTGAILKATASTTYTLNAGAADEWTDNMLMGSSVDTYVDGSAYVLAKVEGNVGLYKAELNKDGNGDTGTTHFKNNAGKAYLPIVAGARFLVFDFGTETGIIETENGNVKTENVDIFDLSGRRVQSAQKGIFIVNGKKVIR